MRKVYMNPSDTNICPLYVLQTMALVDDWSLSDWKRVACQHQEYFEERCKDKSLLLVDGQLQVRRRDIDTASNEIDRYVRRMFAPIDLQRDERDESFVYYPLVCSVVMARE